MVNAIRILSLLVVVQLATVAVLHWPTSGATGAATGGPLMEVASDGVAGLELKGSKGRVRLEKTEQGWQVPALNGLPAAKASLSKLLDGFNGRAGLPVARSEDAAQRFRVAADDYERRLTVSLAGKDRKQVVFFGDTPGAGEIYARRKGDSSIYRVSLGTHMMPLEAGEWLAEDLLSQDRNAIHSLSVNDIRLERAQPESDRPEGEDEPKRQWSVSGLADGADPDPEAASELVSRVAGLRISGTAGDRQVPDDEPAMAIRIKTKDDQTHQYRLYAGDKGEDALLVTDRHETVFTVTTPVFDSIRKAAGKEALTAQPQNDKAASSAGGD